MRPATTLRRPSGYLKPVTCPPSSKSMSINAGLAGNPGIIRMAAEPVTMCRRGRSLTSSTRFQVTDSESISSRSKHPSIPNVGPCECRRIHAIARHPRLPSSCSSPMVVVVFLSPKSVSVIAGTPMYYPLASLLRAVNQECQKLGLSRSIQPRLVGL